MTPPRGRTYRWARAAGRTLWWTADAVLLTMLALALAARSVPPERTWVPQLAALTLPGLLVPAILLAGGLTVGAIRNRTRLGFALAVVHAVLALVGGIRLLPAPSPTGGSGPLLRVLSLNAGRPPADASARFSRLLADERPDVVALQEAGVAWLAAPDTVGQRPDTLALRPPLSPLQRGYRASPPAGVRFAVAQLPVFSRDRPREVVERPLGAPGDPDCGDYTRAVVRWQGRDVAVYNVHLRSFGLERPWQSGQWRSTAAWRRALGSFREATWLRADEAAHLRRLLDAEQLPFVVAGDFNSTPHQWSYAHVARGAADALARHGHPLSSATYPDRRPLVRIDAILASSHWEVVAAHVASGGVSDHRPVRADLRWRTPPPDSAGRR